MAKLNPCAYCDKPIQPNQDYVVLKPEERVGPPVPYGAPRVTQFAHASCLKGKAKAAKA
jgi:hypothetical protein